MTDRFRSDLGLYALGLGLSLGLLFGLGLLLLGRPWPGLLLLALGAIAGHRLIRASDRQFAMKAPSTPS